jgi:hypothetical protein
MWPRLSVAYWSLSMILAGATMGWAAVSQLTSQRGSVYSYGLLTVGVVLIGTGLAVIAAILPRLSK